MATAAAAVESAMVSGKQVEVEPMGRERRNWTARFDDAAGTAHLEVRLERKKTGFKTYIRHTVGEGKAKETTRGATEKHSDERSAKTAFDRAVSAALAAKWVRRQARSFNAKPDAFTLATLPKPAKAR